MTRRQKHAHLQRLREGPQPQDSWLKMLGKFFFLSIALLVARVAIGALAGKAQLDQGTLIWAPAVAATILIFEKFRPRRRA